MQKTHQIVIEFFATGELQKVDVSATGEHETVTGDDIYDALENQQAPCFAVVKGAGRFFAISPANDAFPVPGEHSASTPEAAAASIRNHYSAIKESAAK